MKWKIKKKIGHFFYIFSIYFLTWKNAHYIGALCKNLGNHIRPRTSPFYSNDYKKIKEFLKKKSKIEVKKLI